ncbi:MAG: putative Alpha/beta hydrolase fold protein [Caulobacter sp.]|nr:putative Alpha/beta hydrolase fold protein [Caulobacter sp.]
MPVLDRGGVRIAWDDRGQGTPILLIMGHRYSSAMWYPAFERLGGRYRLISFDNNGTGKSDSRRPTSVAAMTADALAVLDAAGVDSAHVYGVSMGGGIALEFALRHPERTRSVILGCTTAKTEVISRKGSWLVNILYRLPPAILKLLGSSKFKDGYGDAAPDEAIARDMAMLARDPYSATGVLAQHFAIRDYAVDPADVAALKPPALVLHGTQDLAVPYEAGKRLAEMIPGAKLVTFQDIGHNYFVGAGEEANRVVDAFITEVEARR